jgi:hypothetical protein
MYEPNKRVGILAYHAWEIDPQLVMDDVRHLRNQGWRDISLEDLHRTLTGQLKPSHPVFHVTSDDGTRADADLVAALRTLSCPATLFICLERMKDDAEAFFRKLVESDDYHLGDHTLRHDRAFQLRHVVGFHHESEPQVSSPEQLGLKMGAPICSYGSELCLPRFTPARKATELCQEEAQRLHRARPGTDWNERLATELVKSGLGSYRLGRLCIRGEYEARRDWEVRIRTYLSRGRKSLCQFTAKKPFAFAFPWGQRSEVAESHLYSIGYKLTFSGYGLCKTLKPFRIPRLPVSPKTPRPLQLENLDSTYSEHPTSFLKPIARRLFYA